MKPSILSPEAKQDIREIRNYYLKVADASVARHVLKGIERTCWFLAGTPDAGHSRKDLTAAPVKFWQVFSYLVVYDPSSQPINIVRIVHTSRDLKSLFHGTPPRV